MEAIDSIMMIEYIQGVEVLMKEIIVIDTRMDTTIVSGDHIQMKSATMIGKYKLKTITPNDRTLSKV